MEEKMKREKNKNRISNNNDGNNNDDNDGDDDDSADNDTPAASVVDTTAQVADDEVHSHNIDMADQLPTSPSGSDSDDTNNYIADSDIYGDDRQPEHATRTVLVTEAPETELHIKGHERIAVARSSPLPPVEVESEKLEVIEIRSDGTSGHLTHH